MKDRRKSGVMRQYKMDLKRIGKYLLILIPIVLVEAALISMLNLKVWLNVVIIVPTLLVWVVVFELIHIAIQKRKEEKEKTNPKTDIYGE